MQSNNRPKRNRARLPQAQAAIDAASKGKYKRQGVQSGNGQCVIGELLAFRLMRSSEWFLQSRNEAFSCQIVSPDSQT